MTDRQFSIPELYKIRKIQLREKYQTPGKQAIESFRAKAMILKTVFDTWYQIRSVTGFDARQISRKESTKLLAKLKRLGLTLNFTSSIPEAELKEQLKNGGNLLMGNHQGSGLETILLQGILHSEILNSESLNADFRWILKDDLINLPIFGKILRQENPIVVDRKDPRKIIESGTKVANILKEGENVFFFPEGHRSKTGAIAPTDETKALAPTFLKLIERHNKNYNKIGVLIDMYTPIESLSKKTLMKDEIGVHIFSADNLSPEDNLQDPYDQSNLFGNLRHKLANRLEEKIKKDL